MNTDPMKQCLKCNAETDHVTGVCMKCLRDQIIKESTIRDGISGAEDVFEGIKWIKQSLDPKAACAIKKPQLQLVPPVFEEAVAGALQQGNERYGPWNWRSNQVPLMTYLGAIRRHLNAFLDGEDEAPDSGISHLGHIGASCAILLDAKKQGTLVDDRPKKKDSACNEA